MKNYGRDSQPDFEVTGQDKKDFWGSNTLRPDIVIRTETDTFIIDTKWKRPRDKGATVADLRQMYAYNRFWDSKRAMLLYPRNSKAEAFSAFYDAEDNTANHENQCKLGFVHVLKQGASEPVLDDEIGKVVFEMIVD